jgi:hypothetical protein
MLMLIFSINGIANGVSRTITISRNYGYTLYQITKSYGKVKIKTFATELECDEEALRLINLNPATSGSVSYVIEKEPYTIGARYSTP